MISPIISLALAGLLVAGAVVAGRESSRQARTAAESTRDNATQSVSGEAAKGDVLALTTDLSPWDEGAAVAAAPGGGVYVAGATGESGGSMRARNLLLARYAADGTLVPSFGNAGVVVSDFRFGETGSAVAVQRDGSIVVVGNSESELGDGPAFFVARFRPDGTLDPSFDRDGVRAVDPETMHNECAYAFDVGIDANGRILVGGLIGCGGESGTGLRGMLIRLRPDGSFDSSFKRIGVDHVCSVAALAVRPDNRILITGPQTGGAPEYCEDDVTTAVLGLMPDGQLDRAFGRRAQVKLAFPGAGDTFPAALTVDDRGRILVAASSSRRGLAVARLTRRGRYDRRFSRDGRVTRHAGPFDRNLAEDIAVDEGGNVFVVASTDRRSSNASRFVLLKLSSDGAPDTAFGPRGLVTPPFTVDSSGNGVAVAVDGHVFAAGTATSSCPDSDDSCTRTADVAIARVVNAGTRQR